MNAFRRWTRRQYWKLVLCRPEEEAELTYNPCPDRLRRFEETYGPFIMKTQTNLPFGEAIAIAARHGKRISREGWNGKGMFVFVQVPSTVPEEIVPKMSSLPQDVKAEFVRRGGPISYCNQMALVYPDNKIYGWTPSPSDALASDWCVHTEEDSTAYPASPVSETVGTATLTPPTPTPPIL